MPRIAYSYGRFSTGEQEKGHSKQRQDDRFQEFCKLHHLEPATDYRFFDEARSGWKGENLKDDSELIKLITKAKEESKRRKSGAKADAVIVIEDLDRLTRAEPLEAMDLAREILKTGWAIGIHSLNKIVEPNEYGKDLGTILHLMCVFHGAWLFSQKISDRLGSVWNYKHVVAVKEKKPHGAACPRWISPVWEGDKVIAYELHPTHFGTVERIFDWAILGMSARAIAQRLIKEITPCWAKRGVWTSRAIVNILASRAAYGAYIPHTKRGKATKREAVGEEVILYPPAVTKEKWLTIQAKRDARARAFNGRPHPNGEHKNLFGGLLKEVSTGESIYYTDKGRDYVYLETSTPVDGKTIAFPYEEFEAGFFASWARYLPIEDMTSADRQAEKDELQRLDYEIEDLQNGLEERGKELLDPALKSRTLALAVRLMEDEIDKKQITRDQRAGEIGDDHKSRAEEILKLWNQATDTKNKEKRNELRGRVKSLISLSVVRISCAFNVPSKFDRQVFLDIKVRGAEKPFLVGIRVLPDRWFAWELKGMRMISASREDRRKVYDEDAKSFWGLPIWQAFGKKATREQMALLEKIQNAKIDVAELQKAIDSGEAG